MEIALPMRYSMPRQAYTPAPSTFAILMKRTAFITSILTSLACMWGSVSQLQAAEVTINSSYTGTTMLTVGKTTDDNGTIKADSNTVTVNNYTTGNYIMATWMTFTCDLIEGNSLTIKGSNLSDVWGVSHVNNSETDTALTNNHVKIDDSTSGSVVGVSTDVRSKGASATYNTVTITNSTLKNGITAVQMTYGDASYNEVLLEGKSTVVKQIRAANVSYGNVANNIVTLNCETDEFLTSNLSGYYATVYCAATSEGNATGNTVEVKGSTIISYNDNKNRNAVIAGQTSYGTAEGNSVTIAGSAKVTGKVYGGWQSAFKNDVLTPAAVGNTVTVQDNATVCGTIYAGYSNNGNATGNTISLKGQADVSDADLYGGYSAATSTGAIIKNNTLKLDGFQGIVNSVNNFDAIDITLSDWNPAEYILQTTEVMNLSGVTVTLKDIKSIASDAKLPAAGDSFRLFDNYTLDETTKMDISGDYTDIKYGDTQLVDFKIEVDESGKITGMLIDKGVNPQVKALAEGRIAALTLVNRAGDLVSDKGIDQASRAAVQTISMGIVDEKGFSRTQLADTKGVAAFFSMSAGHDKVDSGSHVNVDGIATMLGASTRLQSNKALTLGGFVESGWGQYTTHNSFADAETVRGTGESSYYGGGVLFRYEGARGISFDASFRAGRQTTDFGSYYDNGTKYAGYDVSSPYLGGHFGVNYAFKPTDRVTATAYARYQWGYLGSDNARLEGEQVDFDSTHSNRLRFGARASWELSQRWTPYDGPADDCERSGDARAAVDGERADSPNKRGGSFIGELGVIWRPVETKPLWVNGGIQGSVGKVQGFGANAGCTIAF